jgi:hypothetical protein
MFALQWPNHKTLSLLVDAARAVAVARAVPGMDSSRHMGETHRLGACRHHRETSIQAEGRPLEISNSAPETPEPYPEEGMIDE